MISVHRPTLAMIASPRFWFLSLVLSLALPALAAEPPSAPLLRIEAGMHTTRINRIATDAAGHVALTCSNDKTARLWSLPEAQSPLSDLKSQISEFKPELLRVFRMPIGAGNEGKLYACALSPDGSIAALGGWTRFEWEKSHCIYLIDTASGRLLRRLTGLPNVVNDLAFSASGRALAAGLGGSNGIRVFEVSSGRRLAQDSDYADACYGLDWQGDERLATTSFDGKLRLYADLGQSLKVSTTTDLKPKLSVRSKLGKQPFSIRFSPDGKTLAVGFNNVKAVALLSAEDLSLLHQPEVSGGDNDHVANVCWSQDGRWLAAGGQWAVGVEYSISLWAEAGRGAAQTLRCGTGNTLFDLRALPGGGFLVAAGDPAWAMVVPQQRAAGKTGTGEPTPSFQSALLGAPPIARYASQEKRFGLSADARVLAFGFKSFGAVPASFSLTERRLRLEKSFRSLRPPRLEGLPVTDWHNNPNPKLGKEALKLEDGDLSDSLAIAPDASFFLLGTSWRLRCYAADGQARWQQPAPDSVWALNLSADGRIAVAAYADGTIRWHRADNGQELLAFFPHADQKRWVLWTPQGYYDASPGGEELIGWHLNQGADKEARWEEAGQYRDLFFRPDVIDRVLDTLDVAEAVKLADAERKGKVSTESLAVEMAKRRPLEVELLEVPVTGLEVKSPMLTLRYRLKRTAEQEVQGMQAFIDGLPLTKVKLTVPKDATEVAEVMLPVPERDCVVSLVAEGLYNSSPPADARLLWRGLHRSDTKTVDALKPKLYLVAVGVSDYKAERPLPCAQADARGFADTMLKQKGLRYQDVQVRVLTSNAPEEDMKPTKANIEDQLGWLQQQTTQQDVAMLFIAGHGLPDDSGQPIFAMAGYSPSRASTWLKLKDIKDTMRTISGRRMIFLDTCHSGLGGDGIASRDVNFFSAQSTAARALGGRDNGTVTVFSSCQGRQVSLEDAKLGHGYFTLAAMEGLSGKADADKTGDITVQELAHYLSERVKELSDGHQTPEKDPVPGRDDGFPIGYDLNRK